MAAVEIERVDGGIQREQVHGRGAIAFPYRWDSRAEGWPTQHPRAIRLFDAAGRALDLPRCCTVSQARQIELATRTAP